MALLFSDLQSEVKRRALRNQSGTEYDDEIKIIINASLFRIAREARWKSLRRKTYFTTKSSYTSGTNYVTVTNSSSAVTISTTAANWWTDKIEIGRYIKFGTSSWYYNIRAVNTGTGLTIDLGYRGTTSTATTYEILPQAEYNLPIQVDHRSFLWHEDFGYPFRMFYNPDQTFFDNVSTLTEKNTPTNYKMWEENDIITQVPTATPLLMSSSSATDTTVQVTVFGNVSGYPHYETVILTGTTVTKTAY